MFDALTRGFRAARQKLTGLAELTEDNIEQALRDVRLSLLEADVELGVVKKFLARVKEQAIGQIVQVRAKDGDQTLHISPADAFIKICQDELVRMMSDEKGQEIEYAPKGQPTVIMMVGLQGQGKTTTSAKLARLYSREGKRVLLVAADLQRPAAVDQLEVLGKSVNVPVFRPQSPDATPVDVCRQALQVAKVQQRDIVILDTAGRLAVDEKLMQELADIKRDTTPQNILLVCNAAVGQNALQTAQAFHEKLGLTGAVLTMLDGDARGGAALSIREVTGVAIKFAGVGEGMDKLEAFRPDGMASRVLGFGDVIGLFNDFAKVVDQKKAEKDALELLKGKFTFDDFLEQISTIQKMGPLKELIEKMPFFPQGLPEDMNIDEGELDRTRAMIYSMTQAERDDSSLFARAPSRIVRVAKGSGHKDAEVADLIQRFNLMKQMMGGIGKQIGFMQKLPGGKQMQMAKQLRNMMKQRGQGAGMADFANEFLSQAMGDGMPGMPGAGDDPFAMFGGAMPGAPGAAGPRKPVDKDEKSKQRKAERAARKKSRRK